MSDFREMAARFTVISKERIKECYQKIAICYQDLDRLHNSYHYYNNKRDIYTDLRKKYIDDVRESIQNLFEDIRFWRECISAEKQEMRRIFNTYGVSLDDEFFEDSDEDNDDLDEASKAIL